jgi:mannose-6-phosphate isomerase-like protein (cupin superfamily)
VTEATETEDLHLTPHESIRIRRHTNDELEVEGTWGPGGPPPPKHFHPHQDERFEVLAGRLRVRVDGHDRDLTAGDVLEIPRRAVHQMWNPGSEPARALWRTSPAGRTAQWFADLSALRGTGRVGKDRMPGPLAFGVYLTAYSDVIRLAGPQPLVRSALGLLGALGRLKGYRAPATGTAPAAAGAPRGAPTGS